MNTKMAVIFICTANAARSQMAEGLLRAKYGDWYEVYSAGTHQSSLSPFAVAAMREIGIDISYYRSKTVDEFRSRPIDIAVTLCDNAQRVCPTLPNVKKTIHRGFPDPHSGMMHNEDIRDGYRRVRDEISNWIERTFAPSK